MKIRLLFLLPLALLTCTRKESTDDLKKKVIAELTKQSGVFAVAFKDLSTGEEMLVNEHESFHAASTMKVPVMIEAFKQAGQGKFNLSDSMVIRNEFRSIVDGSPYTLNVADDSDSLLYKQIGQKKSMSELIYDMIIVSSNLATNSVIELVDAKNVTQTMRELGAKNMLVLRGVEDNKAFDKGLINTTTAYDFMLILEKMAKGEIVSKEASDAMIAILLDQKFNDLIPEKLPTDVKVAHKTGFITGLHHDGGIVFLPDGRKYVVVFLSKEMKDYDAGTKAMANASEIIYQHMMQ